MTDMQRYIADDDWLVQIDGRPVTTPVPGEVVVVLASDAEVAIAAAAERAVQPTQFAYERGQREMLATLSDTNPGVIYRTGQRDMLARCIAAVEAIQYRHVGTGRPKYVRKSEVLAALRALEVSE